MPPVDPYAVELEFVKSLAQEAVEIARQRSKRVRPQEKEANLGYVTDLDHDLERLIRTRLGDRFPDDQLTGEEYANEGGAGPRRWSIDPIDGTGNLVHGLPIWAVSIGLIDRGEPVLGVIALPLLGELYWATRGGGAWRDGEPIRAAEDQDGFHNQDNVCIGTNALRVIDPRSVVGRLRDLGSCCSELVWVACGRLVAVCHLGEKAHDLAAGAVIAHEAGCRFGTIEGRTLTPAELIAETPITVPTFTAPPNRLQALMSNTTRLP